MTRRDHVLDEIRRLGDELEATDQALLAEFVERLQDIVLQQKRNKELVLKS